MVDSLFKKSIVVITILFLTCTSFTTNIFGNAEKSDFSINYNIIYSLNTLENGSLSGYVNDTNMSPIEGVRVRVYFHETYEEDYTDFYGFYHVSNIPICYCLKNCTAYKEGYSEEWILLSIYENSTYDYIISCVSMHVNINGPYYGIINKPVHFQGSAYCGNPPYSWFWDFGDGNTSTEQCQLHNYSTTGNYLVTLNVIDNDSINDSEITYAFIEDFPNYPPKAPIINGPMIGIIGEKNSYTILTSDPENNDVFYEILWGDGTYDDWFGPYLSNEAIIVNHTWSEIDIYKTMIRAKDVNGNIGDWASFIIIIPRTREIFEALWLSFLERIPIFEKFLFFYL